MDFIPQDINDYCENHSKKETAVLEELNRHTHVNVLRPRMLSGHLQGKLLEMLSMMIQPESVLEIGTYTGYSAICLAKGLKENGKLITIDCDEEQEDLALEFFEKAGFSDQITLKIGQALDLIPKLKESFDLVFLDADKANYLNYYQLVFDQVKRGGYIIADNVLWSGKVVEPLKPGDKETKAILDFNQFVQEDPRVENVLLPFRDGLMVVKKK